MHERNHNLTIVVTEKEKVFNFTNLTTQIIIEKNAIVICHPRRLKKSSKISSFVTNCYKELDTKNMEQSIL